MNDYVSLLEIENAVISGCHPCSFRSGERATIVSIGVLTTDEIRDRPCFLVRFPDGKEDYIAISDWHNYAIYRKETE